MALIETWVGCDLNKTVQVRQLNGYVFSLDNDGNLMGVRVTQDGEPVTLTGTVTGYAILADGQTVDVTGDSTGIQNGNEAFIILPQLAYSVPGQISIVIKLTTASTITTLAAFTGYVYRSRTGNEVVPPGTPIPDLATLEEAINNANTAATAANTAAAAADNVDISMSQVGDEITITTTDSTGTQSTATLTDQSEAVNDLKTAINTKADCIYPTVSGTIATFPDGADGMPLKSLAIALVPIQEGSGDPSPQNVRPITGHSGMVKVTRAVVNLCGGEQMADDIVSAVGDETKVYKGTDDVGNFVAIVASNALTGKIFLKGCFKQNTQYTVIVKGKKANTSRSTNLRFVYTDGTNSGINYSNIDIVADTVYTYANVSISGKTISHIETTYASSKSTIYYDSFGVFEGVLTVDQFTPYQGQTYPITIPTSAGTVYGGTLDPVKGTLTVDRAIITLNGTQSQQNSKYDGTQNAVARWNISTPAKAFTATYPDAISDKFKVASSAMIGNFGLWSGNAELGYTFTIQADGERIGIAVPLSEGVTDATKLNTWLSNNPVSVCYELAVPSAPIPLDPVTITTLLGQNNIWSDSGSVAVEYPADTKLYIDRKITEAIANALNA